MRIAKRHVTTNLALLATLVVLGGCGTVRSPKDAPPGPELAPQAAPVLEAKIAASGVRPGDRFGFQVALDGDTAVMGVSRAGVAVVFERREGAWREVARLNADAAADDRFGASTAIDGRTIVVGAYGDDHAGEGSGAAYVFRRTGGAWEQTAKLTAADAAAGAWFGFSVGLARGAIVVGAPHDDDAGSSSGAAYVFRRRGRSWSQAAKLTAPDGADGDGFGISVAVDGGTVLVGAWRDDDGVDDAGSAYLFRRHGRAWRPLAKLTAADVDAARRFGISTAIDRGTLVIGAVADDHAGSRSGSAYVFARSGRRWTQEAKLTASDAAPDDFFGFSVAIHGPNVVVGGFGNDDAGELSGSAYLFRRGDGGWTERLTFAPADAAEGDEVGYAAALDRDTLLLGAPGGGGGREAGAVYVYGLGGGEGDEDENGEDDGEGEDDDDA